MLAGCGKSEQWLEALACSWDMKKATQREQEERKIGEMMHGIA